MANKNKKFLKSCLTTASALAVLACGSAETALGAPVRTTTDNATIGFNKGLDSFNDGDTIKLGGPHDVTTGANNQQIGKIDIDNNDGQTFTVGHTGIQLGALVNENGAAGAQVMNVAVGAGFDLSLTGKDTYKAMGAVTLGGATATLNTGGATIGSTIGGGTGILNITGAAVLNKAVNVATVNVSKDATIKADVTATSLVFKGDNTLTVAAGKNITATVTTTSGDNKGTFVFNGAGKIDGKVGADGARVKSIQIADNTTNLELTGDVYAQEIKFGAGAGGKGELRIAAGATLDVTNGVQVATSKKGVVVFQGGATVVGDLGADGALLECVDVGKGAVDINGKIVSQGIRFINNNAVNTLTVRKGFTTTEIILAGDASTIIADGANQELEGLVKNKGPLPVDGTQGVLTVKQKAIVKNGSFMGLKKVNIGDGAASELEVDADATLFLDTKSEINFVDNASQLTLSSSDSSSVRAFDFGQAKNVGGKTDGLGIVKLKADKNALTVNQAKAGTFGKAAGKRLAEFQVFADKDVVNKAAVYAKKITISATDDTKNKVVNLAGAVDVGNEGSTDVKNKVQLKLNAAAKLGTLNLNDKETTVESNNANADLSGTVLSTDENKTAKNATLKATNNMKVDDVSFAGFKNIDIANGKALTFELRNDASQSKLTFLQNNTDKFVTDTKGTLAIKGSKAVDLEVNIANNQVTGTNDDELIVSLTTQSGKKINVTGAAKTNGFGTNAVKLKSLTLAGSNTAGEKITVNVDSYLKTLNVGQIGNGAEAEGAEFTEKVVIGAGAGAGAITYTADKGRLILPAGSEVTGDVEINNKANSFLALGAGTKITGKIENTGGADGQYSLRFLANAAGDQSEITGDVGAAGQRAKIIEVEKNAKVKLSGDVFTQGAEGIKFVADRKADMTETAFNVSKAETSASAAQVTLAADLVADGGAKTAINFNGQSNAKVILDDTKLHKITGNLVVAPAVADNKNVSAGLIEALGAKAHVIVGQIGRSDGDYNQGLQKLSFAGNKAELDLQAASNSQINEINIGAADATVQVSVAGATRVNSVTGNGTLKLGADHTFRSGKASNGTAAAVNFGTAATPLAKLDLQGKTMTVGEGGKDASDAFNIYADDLGNTGGTGITYKSGGVLSLKTADANNQRLRGLQLDAEGKTLMVKQSFHAETNPVLTNGTIAFEKDATSKADFKINGNNGVFVFGGNVAGGAVTTGTAGKGIVTFQNAQAATVAELGNGTKNFAQVVFKNQAELTITKLNFDTNSEAKFVFEDNGNANASSVVTVGTGATKDFTESNVVIQNNSGSEVTVKSSGTGNVASARTWKGKYGSSANGIVALDSVDKDATVETSGVDNGQYARVLTTGDVNFGQENQKVFAVGASQKNVATLTFDKSAEVAENVYAKTINVNKDKIATIKGQFNTTIVLGDTGSKA